MTYPVILTLLVVVFMCAVAVLNLYDEEDF